MTDDAVAQLTQIEQSMEQLAMQRKQFQNQLAETESALANISKDSNSYKLIGNLMVRQDYNTIKKELEEKKGVLKIRISTIEKQEEKLSSKIKEYQEQVMNGLKEKDTK